MVTVKPSLEMWCLSNMPVTIKQYNKEIKKMWPQTSVTVAPNMVQWGSYNFATYVTESIENCAIGRHVFRYYTCIRNTMTWT
jgi:hypothetical protein